MKKFLIISLSVFLFFLSGCRSSSDYTEPEDRIIVASIGIDSQGKNILLTAECININKNSNADEYSIMILEGMGENLAAAVSDLEKSADGDIIFSQCPILVLSTRLSGAQLKDIFLYAADNESIPLAVRVVATESAGNLINSNEDKQPAGYQMMNLMNFGDITSGITENDTLVRVIDGQYTGGSVYKLTYIDYSGGYKIEGCAAFTENGCKNIFNYTDAQILYLLCNDLETCKIVLGGEVLAFKKGKTNLNLTGEIKTKITLNNFEEIKDKKEIESKLTEKITAVIKTLEKKELLSLIGGEGIDSDDVSVNVKIAGEL